MVFGQQKPPYPGSVYPPTDEKYIKEQEAYLKELYEPFGGLEASDARFARYMRAARLLDETIPTLRKKYPDKWVSMDEDGSLTMADTQEELIAALAATGLKSAHFPFAFLNSQPRRLSF